MPRPPVLVELDSFNRVKKNIDARLDEHASHLKAFRNLEAEMRVDRQIQAQRELADKFQAQVVSYANVVIGFGYAGFFALWSMVSGKGVMPPWAHSASGLLIGSSLTLYVGWEVIKMIWTALYVRKAHAKLADEEGILTVNALVAMSQRHERRTYWPWVIVTVPTVLLAAAGAAIVLAFLAKDLLVTIAR